MRAGRSFVEPYEVGKCCKRIISDYISLALASLGNAESWEGYSSSVVSGNRQAFIFAYLLLLHYSGRIGPKIHTVNILLKQQQQKTVHISDSKTEYLKVRWS